MTRQHVRSFPFRAAAAGSVVALVAALAAPVTSQTTPGEVVDSFPVHDGVAGFGGVLDPFDYFGSAIARIGDVDGDGIDDLAVGAPGDDDAVSEVPTGLGAVWILFMESDGTVGSWQKISDVEGGFGGALKPWDEFGWALAPIGDFDGDGVPDLAVGARQDDSGGIGGTADRGAVYVVRLNADGTVKAHTKIAHRIGTVFPTLDDGDLFGSSVAALGDLDGDGVVDLAIGAPHDDDGEPNRGAVWICFLLADGTPKSFTKISATSGGFGGEVPDFGEFGRSVASLGDLDGDGNADIAVGVPRESYDVPFTLHAGAVWILFLDDDGTVAGETKIGQNVGGFTGDLDPDDRLGTSLAALGDLDGDGLLELAAGAPLDDDGGSDRGAVWVLSIDDGGAVQGQQKVSGTAGLFAGPLTDLEHFGHGIASPGDFDGDGIADLVVGSEWGDAGSNQNHGELWMLRLNASRWTDLGSGLAGTHGAPAWSGAGTLVADDPLALTLSGALEHTSATLVVGFSELDAPFKGGVLVPSPDLVIGGLPTGPAGGFTLPGTWPSGIPGGFSLFVQPWIADGAGPVGFAAGNGLQLAAP